MRKTQISTLFANQDADNARPVPHGRLLALANELAEVPVDPAQLVSRSARTVRPPADGNGETRLAASGLEAGLLELPEGAQLLSGIPGRSAERFDVLAGAERKADLGVDQVDGFIPSSASITYNPLPVFGDGIVPKRARRPVAVPDQVRGNGPNLVIFGGDDRINIYPSGYPETAVCRVEVYTQDTVNGPWIYRHYGTGFMVGERIMMTAGHMAPPGPYAGWMMKVVPAYYDGSSVYGAGFLSYVSDFHYWHSDTGNDMMVCRLYDALGTTTGYFGAKTYSSSWEDGNYWSMCGYPADRGFQRPTFQGGIPVRDDDDGDDIRLPDGSEFDTTQIESEADEYPGASGSPLYSWFEDGQLCAIGVHHGTETDWTITGSETWSAAAGGPGLPGIINWARSVWPA